ncbi:MAG: hypothetical protein GC149_20320 [Gammaproteobacteria bacterium]|nr:hypothetical protein [Gammaproteobacteria bacterium]
MPWNGSGTFTRNQDFTDDRDSGAPEHFIDADKMDDEFDNFKAGLEAAWTRNGENKPTADLNMNSKKFTNVANAALRTQFAAMGQVQDGAPFNLTSVAGTNTITATAAYSMTAYAAGQTFRFIAADTNDDAVTLNINSIDAKAIQKNGAALVAGDITTGDAVEVYYDGTQFQMLSPARTPVLTDKSIGIGKISSGAATSGQVAVADGSGGVSFADTDPSGYNLPLYVPVEWLFSSKPSNTVWLNGQTIGKSSSGADIEDDDLEGLFDLIVAEGAVYGNTGSEDFASGDTVKLPDDCGRVVAGKDNMGGISSKNRLTGQSGGINGDNLGATGGAETHALTSAQNGPHYHGSAVIMFNYEDLSWHDYNGTISRGSGASIGQGSSGARIEPNTSTSGSGTAHNNVQPTIIRNKIIRYK